MANYSGHTGVVKAGSPAVAVLEVHQFNHRNLVALHDNTSQGQSSRTRKPGLKDGNGTITCYHDPDDTTGQRALVEGAELAVELYPIGEAAGSMLSGTIIVESVEIATPLDGMVGRTISYQNYLAESDIA